MTKQDKKGITVLIIIGSVILVSIVLSVIIPRLKRNFDNSNFVTNVTIRDNNLNVDTSSYKKEFIATLYIEGVIEDLNMYYDQDWVLNTIYSLKENQNNVALAIYIDSPGGGVYQADEVYLALQDYKTTGRPVFVYQGPMAASGGYYISCAADKIYANRNTLTGCIGVIFGQSIDVTGLLDKVGIKSKTFHSGRNKTMLGFDEPLTEEQDNIMQVLCDEAYEQFVRIVANGRNMSYEEAVELSDGRLYSARQALDNGLVDGIDSWDNMLTTLAEDVLNKPGIKIIEYQPETDMMLDFFNFIMSSVSKLQRQETASKLGVPSYVIDSMEFNSYPAYLYRN